MNHDLIQNFIEHLTASGKSRSTIIAYGKDLEQLFAVLDKPVNALQKQDLKAALEKLKSNFDFSPKTLSRKLNSFRTFFKFLHQNGKINENIASSISHPKVASKPPRILTQPEYLALREVSRSNIRVFTMVELMLQTGIRIGELSRLKVADVELDPQGGNIVVREFSTTPTRSVPLNNRAREVLVSYLNTYTEAQPDMPLFASRAGKPLIIRNIRSTIDKALVKAGVEDACVNDLRNTFIALQLKAGVALDVVSEAVGHKNKSTTQKYIDLLGIEYAPNGNSKLVEI